MVYAYQNWKLCQLLKCRQFFRVSFILIFVHHSVMTINFKLSFIPTIALRIWFSFYVFFFGLNSGVLAQSTCPHGWLKNDNSCYLFVTHVDNDWTESEVQCTLSTCTPCLINDKHTGIISVIFLGLQESICNSLRKNCFSISVTWLDPNW